ncbi:peptide/nickel transport system permease protein [Bacillus oleivorans]|uniref:Peptide/nickel transport system permease protein n=1 Tax=Bacillus oleivorans TaxID=1448271 RepID=A0A285D6Z0_9BACI|nr:ABC transporter permease subunit [Bacillus oleivorans]SNX75028.1 peptide/nickel transport system permease protein [Bacillus oleivorans]
MTKSINYKLIIGLLFLSFFVFIAIFGPSIAPYNKDYKQQILYSLENGGEIIGPPSPPSQEFWLGTDKYGYDILTKLLYGAKYTVFTTIIVALLRTVIGTILGIIMGLSKKSGELNKSHFPILSSIPTFIIIYFVMISINIEPVLSVLSLVLIQGALMTILGVSGVFNVVYAKTAETKNSIFVMASQTLGGSRIHIMKKHIFPMLKGNLLILFVNETIQVLHLIGQLGIFNLFLGGTSFPLMATKFTSITNEWSGLLGESKDFLYYAQWILLCPLAVYLLFLFTFYLISLGLNERHHDQIAKTRYL